MRLFEPLRVGTMDLRNRILVPTHAAGAGRILGSEKRRRALHRVLRAPRARRRGVDRRQLDVPARAADPRLRAVRASAPCCAAPIATRCSSSGTRATWTRCTRPGACGDGADDHPGRAAPRRVAGGQRVRRPGRPARADARRDRRDRRGVRLVGGAGARGRARRPRAARQPRRPAPVLPLAAVQPPRRRVRRVVETGCGSCSRRWARSATPSAEA